VQSDGVISIRELIGATLSLCGYTVQLYSSPAEATIFDHPESCPLSTGRDELFDNSLTCAELIVTDVRMPFISGIEYVRKLRQVGCRVRYIAIMSGSWSAKERGEAEAMGCKIFLKPLSVAEFQGWVLSLGY
jgi:CheY-like chemotaxis protein